MAYLYRHIRLDTNEVFYVGIGLRENHRRARTIVRRNQYWKNVVAKTKWIAEIILDEITVEEAMKKEIEFISLYGRKDIGKGTLVNLTDGGTATKGYKVSEEMKLRLSEINMGKKLSQDHINKISVSNTGKIHSPSALLKMRNAKLGTIQSEETINKRRLKLFGNKSNTGKTWSLVDGKRIYKGKVL